ncbi:MAG: lysylphosphatidylglycerol synthase transmembrane domain-containing protein [Candidatus Omnitrophica bacterium]|nr:lysylphosphatidylglycerol synthase transmembrane domain-containing protein [Candidatus Omnitrophota bacterium]
MNIKTLISGLIRFFISLTLMAAILYIMRDSLPGMVDTLKHTSPYLFILSMLIFIISIAIASFRLRILLEIQGIRMTTMDVFRVNLIGYFFSSFLPTSVGGDVVKAFYISKESKKNMQAYTSVFLDRFLGMFTIFLIAMAAIFLVQDTSGLNLIWFLPVFVALSLIFIAVLYNKTLAKKFLPIISFVIPSKFQQEMRNVYNAMHGYKHHGKAMAVCFALSIIGQVVGFSAIYFLASGIKSYIPMTLTLLVMPVAAIVGMLPSINGIGPREMSIVIMLRQFTGASAAGAIAFLWLGALLLTSLLGGIVYMFMGHYKINIANLSE